LTCSATVSFFSFFGYLDPLPTSCAGTYGFFWPVAPAQM
jgi:hypothetical protein